MIRSAVTISLVPEARGGPFVFWDDLEVSCQMAADLGFDAVELFLPHAKSLEVAHLRQLLDSTGLSLAAVGTGAGWILHRLRLCDPDEQRRRQAGEFVRSMIDFGAALGAPAIVGSIRGPATLNVEVATARRWLCESLEELGAFAGSRGTYVLLEPLNRYETNVVNTLADGVEIISELATKNIRLLADCFHMNIEETDMAGAIRKAGRHIGHVHFVDSNREAAGRGHIDFQLLRDSLHDINYDGYLSAEARPVPDSRAAAETTIATFKRLFG